MEKIIKHDLNLNLNDNKTHNNSVIKYDKLLQTDNFPLKGTLKNKKSQTIISIKLDKIIQTENSQSNNNYNKLLNK
jgi:hypothetical protein